MELLLFFYRLCSLSYWIIEIQISLFLVSHIFDS